MTEQAAPSQAGTRGRKDRGAVLMLTAIALPVLLLMTAFSVDLGRQRAARRDMQAKADVIALDLARIIDGTPANLINYSSALAASASRNDVPVAKITAVQWGTLDAATKKFVACTICVPSAVKVTTHDTISYFFQRGTGSVTRSAVGSRSAIAGFAIGSFAAAINPLAPNDATGSLLNNLLGNSLGAGVLGYSGLASSNLTYLGIANELGFGTPSELFTSNTSAYDALHAQAEILRRNSGNAAQVAVLDSVLAVSNSPLKNVTVGQIANVQAGGENAALGSNVNVLDFLSTGAFIANGSGLSIPATLIGIPGLSGNMSVNLVQGPQTAFGGLGAWAETSQADITLSIPIASTTACGSANALTTLLTGLLGTIGGLLNILLNAGVCPTNILQKVANLTATATFGIHLAKARGTIDNIACGTSNKQLGVGVNSGLVSTDLDVIVTTKVGTTTLPTFGVGLHTTGNGSPSRADFTLPPEVFGTFKSTTPASGSLGLVPAQLDTQGLGLFLASLHGVIDTVSASLNTNLIQPLAKLLGVRVASADVAPLLVNCTAVKLTG